MPLTGSLLSLLLLFSFAAPALAKTLSGDVVKVVDGDTIHVLHVGHRHIPQPAVIRRLSAPFREQDLEHGMSVPIALAKDYATSGSVLTPQQAAQLARKDPQGPQYRVTQRHSPKVLGRTGPEPFAFLLLWDLGWFDVLAAEVCGRERAQVRVPLAC